MINCTARRTRSERSALVPSRPSMSARSRSRVFSVAAILFIMGCSLRASGANRKPVLLLHSGRVHPKPFSSKSTSSPDHRIANLKRDHVVKLMAARAQRPMAANNLRKVLRAMMRHAIEIGLRADDPTRDVRAIRVKSDGFHSWNDDEIAQFEKRHPTGTPARLALALLLYTGQRRSDVVRMGPQHIRNGVLGVRQQKTGFELAIPVHSTLAAVIAETPTCHLTFLTNQFGRPFTAGYFGQWFREQCDMAGLRHCSAHGLRKAAARRLAEAGCTAHEIAAITGHASLKEIEHYTKAVDQQKLAASAMEKTSTFSGQPYARLAKKRKKP